MSEILYSKEELRAMEKNLMEGGAFRGREKEFRVLEKAFRNGGAIHVPCALELEQQQRISDEITTTEQSSRIAPEYLPEVWRKLEEAHHSGGAVILGDGLLTSETRLFGEVETRQSQSQSTTVATKNRTNMSVQSQSICRQNPLVESSDSEDVICKESENEQEEQRTTTTEQSDGIIIEKQQSDEWKNIPLTFKETVASFADVFNSGIGTKERKDNIKVLGQKTRKFLDDGKSGKSIGSLFKPDKEEEIRLNKVKSELNKTREKMREMEKQRQNSKRLEGIGGRTY
ncbi:MAG: hypothetical protein LBC92_03465 [Rickettsiales bacterium]|jgi:hypothetical protein|nr:hypothetical protein [Rickettsiales bacterium]